LLQAGAGQYLLQALKQLCYVVHTKTGREKRQS
jgi:hypothetical protein